MSCPCECLPASDSGDLHRQPLHLMVSHPLCTSAGIQACPPRQRWFFPPTLYLPPSAGYSTESVLVETFEPGRSVAHFIRNPHPWNTQASSRAAWGRVPPLGCRCSGGRRCFHYCSCRCSCCWPWEAHLPPLAPHATASGHKHAQLAVACPSDSGKGRRRIPQDAADGEQGLPHQGG